MNQPMNEKYARQGGSFPQGFRAKKKCLKPPPKYPFEIITWNIISASTKVHRAGIP